jgi:hypothetical protein
MLLSLGRDFICIEGYISHSQEVGILLAAGVLLGCDPAILTGAIVSASIFGENLAPISDTTIISAGTQEYTKKQGL